MATFKPPLLIFLALLAIPAEAYKIIFLLPLASTSHKNVFDPLVQELSTRNHDITIASPYKSKKPLKNVHEMIYHKEMPEETIKGLLDHLDTHPLLSFYFYQDFALTNCDIYINDPKTEALLKKGQQFDVAVVSGFMNECAMTTAPLLAKTIIFLSPGPLFSWVKFFVPRPPSYVPNTLLPYTARMNFFQRMNNVFNNVGQQLIMDWSLKPAVEGIVHKKFPNALSVDEAMKKVDFVLTNVDPVLVTPRPTMPNIVNVGGMHCVEPKPLPKEFDDFVKTVGDEGFILFSLGSNAQSKFLPKEKKDNIVKALASLKAKVIWKFEEDFPNLPANIKITKWQPQQDLLGHPKCKLFITHGGLLSLQETLYHGVPIVAVPLFGDQPGNIARVEELQIGKKIEYKDINAESFAKVINEVLSDKKYSENMKKYSAIFKDQYQRPEKRAAFWVEYVVRHNGAKHFRSAGERLNFFQYFLLDVIGLLLGITAIAVLVSYKAVRFVVCKIHSCKSCKGGKKSDKEKKTN